jgi:hypothetical protein
MFHRAVELASCSCKNPHEQCYKLKEQVNDLVSTYVGGSYVVVGSGISLSDNCSVRDT